MSDDTDTSNIAVIIIRNPKGQFYTHQRKADKKVFPNLYGTGAGGHIRKSESPAQAAHRELLEETGINAEPKFLFSFPYTSIEGPHETYVFELLTKEQVAPDDIEWQWSGWLSTSEVDRLIEDDKLMPDTKIFYERYIKSFDGVQKSLE